MEPIERREFHHFIEHFVVSERDWMRAVAKDSYYRHTNRFYLARIAVEVESNGMGSGGHG